MRNYDIIYRVAKGDTLALVSLKYDVPISLILHDNNISGDIYEGQRLIISAVKGTVYTVKPSDTLESLSLKFGVDKETILKENNIEMLYPFMSIVLKKAE